GVGGRLALNGHRVTLVGRKPLVDAVAAAGLCLRSPDDEAIVSGLRVVTSVASAAPHGSFDLALFTVKTFDTEAAIAEMLAGEQEPNWGKPTILSLQNGVRSEEALAEAFGAARVVAGTELNPISVQQPGVIVLEKWRGGVGLAPVVPDASVARWVQVFDHVVLPTYAYADYRAMKWSKLLLNLIGNASAAILDMSTVEVFDDPRLFRLEIEMLRETVRVMRGLGIKPVKLPGYPSPLLAWGVRWAPFFLLRPIMRKMVAGGRGDKPPSLLLELRRGRRRSEVTELNGAVVRAGEQVGQPTPVNRALAETLGRLVEGQIQWDSVRRQPEVLLAVVEELKRKMR
ncbi:MAG: 2-dehydropantoate 2-reductase N-terminal domain-containing protein, partial [Anaerolineae bacterium]